MLKKCGVFALNDMKQMGHEDTRMFFYVESADVLASALGGNARVLAEEPYYGFIKRSGLKLITKISKVVADRFGMVKMVHLALGD